MEYNKKIKLIFKEAQISTNLRIGTYKISSLALAEDEKNLKLKTNSKKNYIKM